MVDNEAKKFVLLFYYCNAKYYGSNKKCYSNLIAVNKKCKDSIYYKSIIFQKKYIFL